MKYITVNIPHSSVCIPDFSGFVLPEKEMQNEALKLADLYTDEMIVGIRGVIPVIAPVSRIYVDTERFADDEQEEAFKYGMGVIYTRTHDGKILRKQPLPEEKEALLKEWYYPHHSMLEQSVLKQLHQRNQALILDLHSYPTTFDMLGIKNKLVPDICIGFDDFHSDIRVLKIIINWCIRHNYTYAVNNPFSGAIVPMQFYRKNPSVFSYMIEIRRDFYMNEITFEKRPAFYELKLAIKELMIEFQNIRLF